MNSINHGYDEEKTNDEKEKNEEKTNDENEEKDEVTSSIFFY